MRVLFWFLLLAAAAVGVAIAARLTSGYVLLVSPPYRIEVSLNLFILLSVAAFIALHLGFRLVRRAVGLPAEVRALRRRQQHERSRARQDSALVALLEGRYGRARRFAEESLAEPDASGLAALIGARAALEMRDFADAELLLARPEVRVQSLAVPRLTLEAQLQLEQGRPQEALAKLQELRTEAGLHTAALRLEMLALQAAGRHADVPALVDQLLKRKVYGPAEAELLRAAAQAAELKTMRHDAAGLRSYWNRLSDAEQRVPLLARAAARSFLALGGDRDAVDIIARALERQWDPALVLLLAECRPADGTRQLEIAEGWLGAHSQDPRVLYVLGVLCQRQQLWGKAQTYLEASLALENGHEAHLALGELLARLGRTSEADTHLAAALDLALAELAARRAESPAPPASEV